MEIHEFYIPSSSGIANLHCMEWIPSGEVKAIVQIAHGMMEHVGRYREFAEFLAGHGIYVLGMIILDTERPQRQRKTADTLGSMAEPSR